MCKRVWWKLTSWNWLLGGLPSYEFLFSSLHRDISGWQVCFPVSQSLHTWCTPQCLFYGCSYKKPATRWQAFFMPESVTQASTVIIKVCCFFPLGCDWAWNVAKHTTKGLCVFLSSPFTYWPEWMPSPRRSLCRVVLTTLEATLRRLEIGKPSAEEEEDRVTFQSSSGLQGPPTLVGIR